MSDWLCEKCRRPAVYTSVGLTCRNPQCQPTATYSGSTFADVGAELIKGQMSQKDARIAELEAKLAAAEADAGRMRLALETLISVAEKCDGWESFPSDALDAAIDEAMGRG